MSAAELQLVAAKRAELVAACEERGIPLPRAKDSRKVIDEIRFLICAKLRTINMADNCLHANFLVSVPFGDAWILSAAAYELGMIAQYNYDFSATTKDPITERLYLAARVGFAPT